jgi:hypothetical protein
MTFEEAARLAGLCSPGCRPSMTTGRHETTYDGPPAAVGHRPPVNPRPDGSPAGRAPIETRPVRFPWGGHWLIRTVTCPTGGRSPSLRPMLSSLPRSNGTSGCSVPGGTGLRPSMVCRRRSACLRSIPGAHVGAGGWRPGGTTGLVSTFAGLTIRRVGVTRS